MTSRGRTIANLVPVEEPDIAAESRKGIDVMDLAGAVRGLKPMSLDDIDKAIADGASGR